MTSFKGKSMPGRMSRRYNLFREAMILLCRFLFGLRVYGAERVPEEEPLVVAANHSQYSDPVLVCVAVPRRLQWMAKKQVFAFPFRRFFEFIGSFPVDREGGGRAGLRAALAFLSEGWALGIFPEGTHRGSARAAKTGVVMLAVRARAAVLPVYVGRLPGPISRLRGERLRIFIGEPMEIDGTLRGREAYKGAAEGVLRAIYALPEDHARSRVRR